MINLSEWLDSRGTFKDVAFGDVELQIVSLSDDLIDGLKSLPSHEAMINFVGEHGLSHNRTRIFDDENLCEDLPMIWAMTEFVSAKAEIVKAICELSGITSILADKLEAEEMAALELEEKEKADMVLNGDGEMPLHEDLGKIQADMNAHNNIN